MCEVNLSPLSANACNNFFHNPFLSQQGFKDSSQLMNSFVTVSAAIGVFGTFRNQKIYKKLNKIARTEMSCLFNSPFNVTLVTLYLCVG